MTELAPYKPVYRRPGYNQPRVTVTCPGCGRKRQVARWRAKPQPGRTLNCLSCRGFSGPPTTTPPPPPEPTYYAPGSPGKVAVMAARVAAGFLPHHPDDAVWSPYGELTTPSRGAYKK